MALTELQLPNKVDFYNQIQSLAGEMESRMLRWEQASEFLANVDTNDLDNMGVAAGQIRSDLADFRAALDDIVSVYRGNAVTPAKDPSLVMDRVRRMLTL